jgi:hypothetical protein
MLMCEFANLRMCGLDSLIRTSANSQIRTFAIGLQIINKL